jgi:AraC-like DNA-binding protein
MTSAVPFVVERSRFVERVRSVAPARGGTARVDRLPDGRTALVFRVIEPGTGEVHIVGPRTRALLKDATRLERAVVVELKPGWSAPLFGLPAHELTDRYVALDAVWGSSVQDLVAELVDAPGTSEAVTCFERAFVRFARPTWEPTSAALARRAARMLEEVGARVELVADRIGVTARHLRRVFVENIGVGPKEFARAARLQRAVRLSRVSCDWGRIAAASGYYDQAHLIAEFRALVGLTPVAFAKRAGAARAVGPPEFGAIGLL